MCDLKANNYTSLDLAGEIKSKILKYFNGFKNIFIYCLFTIKSDVVSNNGLYMILEN